MHHHRISKFQGQLRKYLLRYWVSGRFQYLDKLMNSWQQRKEERKRGRERERRRVGDRTWKRGIRPPSIRALSEYPTVIFRARRELRQPWRRWQRKRQKTNKQTNKKQLVQSAKQQPCAWSTLFDTFLYHHCKTSTISSFIVACSQTLSRSSSASIDKNRRGQATFIIEDVNTLATIFFFLFWTWIRSLRIQLLINSHSTHSSHITLSLSTDNTTDKLMEQRWVRIQMAPSYANLFMGKFEQPALACTTHFPLN